MLSFRAVTKPLESINQFIKKDKKNTSLENVSITISKQGQWGLFSSVSHSREAAVRECSSKKVFLKISQYWQENSCVGDSF